MPVSLLRSLLTLRETPFPKTLLITDGDGVSGVKVVEHLRQQFLSQEYCVHYVVAAAFTRGRKFNKDDPNIHYYFSTFDNYGEDRSPFDIAVEYLNRTKKKSNTTTSTIPRLTVLNSSTFNDPSSISYKPPNEGNNNDRTRECQSLDTNSSPTTSATCTNDTQSSSHTIDSSRLASSAPIGPASPANGSAGQKSVLIVDKVEDVLLFTGLRGLITSLRSLVEDRVTVVLWCSRSLLPSTTMTTLQQHANATLDLYPSVRSSTDALVRLCLSRSMGRLHKSNELLSIDKTTGAVSTEAASEGDSSDSASNSDCLKSLGISDAVQENAGDAAASDVISSHTTFSLTLSEEERQKKNSLLLPHQRIQQTGGVVHYTPDKEDFDEDDPDDDLDI